MFHGLWPWLPFALCVMPRLAGLRANADVPSQRLKRFLDALYALGAQILVADLALGGLGAAQRAVGRLAAQHDQIAVQRYFQRIFYIYWKGAPYFDRNYYSAKVIHLSHDSAWLHWYPLLSNAHVNYENTQEPLALNNTLRKVYNITYHIVNTILADYQGKSIHMIIQINCIYIRCVCTTLLWRNERKKVRCRCHGLIMAG